MITLECTGLHKRIKTSNLLKSKKELRHAQRFKIGVTGTAKHFANECAPQKSRVYRAHANEQTHAKISLERILTCKVQTDSKTWSVWQSFKEKEAFYYY